MLNRSRYVRRGITLIELLVTMVVGGIALALVAAASVRQQRVIADLSEAAALSAQIREAAAILPIDLRGAASGAGDIGTARDTALEVRGTIASAVVCDTTATEVVLAPSSLGPGSYAEFVRSIEVGDTAWVLMTNDSTEDWKPYGVRSSGGAAAGACSSLGPQLAPGVRNTPRVALGLAGLASSAALGMPVRVTRPLRYNTYRGTDGLWYLGERDWNTVTMRFNIVQPVSGPFLSPSSGGVTFRYLDSSGSTLIAPVADTRSIAVIHVDVRGQTKRAPRALSAAGSTSRLDSSSIWVLLHNRR